MRRRIVFAAAFATACIALSGCPREPAPSHDVAPAAEPATPATVTPAQSASIAPPLPAEPQPQGNRTHVPMPEPEPATPPPPVDH